MNHKISSSCIYLERKWSYPHKKVETTNGVLLTCYIMLHSGSHSRNGSTSEPDREEHGWIVGCTAGVHDAELLRLAGLPAARQERAPAGAQEPPPRDIAHAALGGGERARAQPSPRQRSRVRCLPRARPRSHGVEGGEALLARQVVVCVAEQAPFVIAYGSTCEGSAASSSRPPYRR